MKQFTDDLDAILYIEEDQSDEETTIAAWQHLLDTGTVWKLQGSYQRGARDLLEAGLIHQKDQVNG